MQTPATRHLTRPLAEAARTIAERVAAAGGRAWIVGGAVRDLCLGRRVDEVDMASDLEPDALEPLFEQTIPVGKAFGTLIVVLDGLSVEVTTFRSEHGYSDGRRPDVVRYGHTPEEDAQRRDFTCNALFLDPLTEELLDPTGGRADLEAGLLRTVGEPRQRFGEDALRLLRMARFHALYDLELEPATLAAATETAPALVDISRERILDELSKLLTRRSAHRGVRLMLRTGVLQAALPGLEGLHGPRQAGPEALERRVAALEWLESTDLVASLALLLDPLDGPRDAALELLDGLKPSRDLRRGIVACWDLLDQLEALAPEEESRTAQGPDRSARLRILRSPAWAPVRDLAAAWGDDRALAPELEGGHLGRMGRELAEFGRGLAREELSPEPLLSSSDLAGAKVPPGPRWGQLLELAEEQQLQGLVAEREAALAWLQQQLAEPT